MESQLLWIFQNEVAFQCRAFMASLRLLDGAMVKKDAMLRDRTHNVGEVVDGIFIALQGMLVSAANISKLLWGSGGRLESQREPLRRSLNVDDSSCLRDPNLRNDFEHFDERVDRWYSQGHKVFMGRNVGPWQELNLSGVPPTARFQQFDPTTGIVTFWDHSVSILDLGREVVDLFANTKAALDFV